MAKGGKKGCFKACCITVLVVFALVIAMGAFVFLYTPTADALSKKIAKNEELTVNLYTQDDGTPGKYVLSTILYMSTVSDVEFEATEIVEFYSSDVDEDDPDFILGVVVYTDSISSAYKIMIDYIQFLMESKGSETELLQFHFSPRGKALFFGNLKGELEFRKVVF